MPKYDQILIVGDCNIHVCCPCMLFKVINSVLNAPLTGTEASTAVCENVLHYFIDKVTSTRALIPPPASDPSVFVPYSVVLYKFEPVTLPFVQETVGHLKPSGSPNDTVPPQIFKQAFPTVGSSCLTIINLSSGVVPANLKHAVVQPLLKKKKMGLDPTVLANYRPISKLPFLSKILENIAYSQVMDVLKEQNIH